MGLNQWIRNFFNPEHLWTYNEGLAGIIKDNGEIRQIPTQPKPDVKGYQPILTEQEKREQLFNSMIVWTHIVDLNERVLVADVPAAVDAKVNKIISNKNRYEQLAHRFPNPIKWYHIAFIHEMECSQNFRCYLGNGQPFDQVTTIVPKGRGAFPSFEAGAIDAIRYDKLDKVQDWSIGNALYILEGFNGYGYAKYHNINSPYLWSGSNHYTAGLYVSDGKFSSHTVSQQIGIALLMKRLFEVEGIT